MSLAELSDEQILDRWNDENRFNENSLTFEERDKIFPEILRRGLFPNSMQSWEEDAGLYPEAPSLYTTSSGPSTEEPYFMGDPKFVEKLLRKKEFLDTRQKSIAEQAEEVKKGKNPCDPEGEFELSATQRFVSRFLSPQCPYNSALLFHGVGVGKTCAAISIAEGYLSVLPKRQVFIIAPRTIQAGFKRTIFDEENLRIPEADGEPNTARGCTGNSYLQRTDNLYEKDRTRIVRDVQDAIKSRYVILGYLQFYNYIQNLLSSIPKGHPKEKEKKDAILRREFSGRLIIIDEAHNLRDTPGDTDDSIDTAGGDLELSESQAGKKLTPTLMNLLDKAQGCKLVLLTGTPMYNSYREIVFLLNLLLINDKKATLSDSQIFAPNGSFMPASATSPGGEKLLGIAAQAYVSFMRGENPFTFPKRLAPMGAPKLEEWPSNDVAGAEVGDDAMRARMLLLPFVPVSFPSESPAAETFKTIVDAAAEKGGTGLAAVDEMVQAGNWIFPTEDGGQVRDVGFDAVFEETVFGQLSQFKLRDSDAKDWLLLPNLEKASPKAALLMKKCRSGDAGVRFVYSRFIKSGGLPLAIALEANGYTAWGRDKPLFGDGILDGLGRQCAMCSRREKDHAAAKHGKFVPAKYILITGRASVSPNNPAAIAAARALNNQDGSQIKVIIGSQVAAEGVDFRFVREIFVFDSWYHLNKMEQVLGRGVRTCSHALLDPTKRNCTIYLLVNVFEDEDRETADLTMYRTAMGKAIQVGRVTRVLKQYAIDCNLNRAAIVVKDLGKVDMVDAQGNRRKETLDDTPMTAVCDWIEGKDACDYKCIPDLDLSALKVDISTYDEYAARWKESQIKAAIKKLFEEKQQPMIMADDILDIFSAIPQRAIAAILSEIIENKSFRIKVKGREGYLVYRNGFYLFQPFDLIDMRIPLPLRIASLPVKRDSYDFAKIMEERRAVIEAAVAPPEEVAEEAEEDRASGAAAPAAAPAMRGRVPYWEALKAWMATVEDGSFSEEAMPYIKAVPAKHKDTVDHIGIPAAIRDETKRRYPTSDEARRELFRYGMILWMYEYMTAPKPPAWLTEYKADDLSDEKKAMYRKAFAQAVLEFFWDTNLNPNEQQYLVRFGDEKDKLIGREQRVQKGSTEAFRYIDPLTGKLLYICATGRCSDAVTRVFEQDASDPINTVKANTTTTGSPYGFMVPEAKKAVIVFKTNLAPPSGTAAPDEGSKCSNISTIPVHTRMLRDIRGILENRGYTKLFLYDRILDEDEIRRKEAKDIKKAKDEKTEPPKRTVPEREHMTRNLITATRPCTVKELLLRWLDVLERGKGLRYFYRPVSALKSGHKGRTAKE
jgi:hypothetical protein